jgi:hypothetical protein
MNICLGAYATEADAIAAKAERGEPQNELTVVQDGDAEHPWRIWWSRTA